jgi:small-conductance mechanosensitive channel
MADETTTTEETTQLQQTGTDVTIASPESGNPAGAASSSDESGDAQGKIIEQQQSTIEALLSRTEQLTKQLNMLVAQGVQITDETPNAQQQKAPVEDDYVSLSDLGRNIGKPNKVGE